MSQIPPPRKTVVFYDLTLFEELPAETLTELLKDKATKITAKVAPFGILNFKVRLPEPPMQPQQFMEEGAQEPQG